MAFTKEQQREYYEKHKEEINAKRKAKYNSNTEVRDAKKTEIKTKLLYLLSVLADNDGGKLVKSEWFDKELILNWSQPLVTNREALANTLDVSKQSVTRYMNELEKEDYIKFICNYLLEESTYPAKTYIVNIDRISKVIDKNEAHKLIDSYYNSLVKDDKDTTQFADKLMNNPKYRPMIEMLVNMIQKENEERPPELAIRYMEFKDGKYYGLRYYSKICNTRNPDKHNNNTERKDTLNDIFGIDADWEEFDISSCQPRLIHDLTKDELYPKDKDIYYDILKHTGIDMTEEEFITPVEFTKQVIDKSGNLVDTKYEVTPRDFFKRELSAIMMNLKSVYLKSTFDEEKAKYSDDGNVKELLYRCKKCKKLFGIPYQDFVVRLKEAYYKFTSIYNFEGDLRIILGKYEFIYEAMLFHYMNVLFRENGYTCGNCYDGFWFIKNTMTIEIFNNTYDEAIALVKKFLKKYNHNIVDLYGKPFKTTHLPKVYKKVPPKNNNGYNNNLQNLKDEHYSEEKINKYVYMLEEAQKNGIFNLSSYFGDDDYDEEDDF